MCEAEGLEGKRGNRWDAPHPRRTVKHSWRNKELKPEEHVDVDLRVCCPYFAVSVMKFGETDLGVCSGGKFRDKQTLVTAGAEPE